MIFAEISETEELVKKKEKLYYRKYKVLANVDDTEKLLSTIHERIERLKKLHRLLQWRKGTFDKGKKKTTKKTNATKVASSKSSKRTSQGRHAHSRKRDEDLLDAIFNVSDARRQGTISQFVETCV